MLAALRNRLPIALLQGKATFEPLKRSSSYLTSPAVSPLSEYPEVEIVYNPPEWKYVERLLPKSTVPRPIVKSEYPSGWRPASIDTTSTNVNDLLRQNGYFVGRTRNYMIPVYLHVTFRGQRRVTRLRYVQGNLWKLEAELRQLVERARAGRPCATRVNEMSGQIHIHGDYVDIVRDYLKSKGF